MGTGVGHMRGRPRQKIFEPVELRIGTDTRRAHLLDLSAGGAQAHCADPPEAGASLILMVGEVPHIASVVWSAGTRFGMAFRFGLSNAEIDRVIGQQSTGLALSR